jgi:hypothetical protein
MYDNIFLNNANNVYFNSPSIKKCEYNWFYCPLDFRTDKIQEDYYFSYRIRGNQNDVSKEDLSKLIGTVDYFTKSCNWELLQEIIHKFKLSENTFILRRLAIYKFNLKEEDFFDKLIKMEFKSMMTDAEILNTRWKSNS